MKSSLTRFLGTLAISFGLTSAAWGQQALPLPTVDGGNAPAPAAPGAATPVVPGGCLDAFLPHGGLGGNWVAGGGVYYMAPLSSNFRAFSGTPIVGAATDTNFNLNLNVAPLAFIGYSWDNGFGVRFRWFQFDADASAGGTLSEPFTDALGNSELLSARGAKLNASGHLYVVGQIWWGTGSVADGAGSQSGAPSNLGFLGGVARAGISF